MPQICEFFGVSIYMYYNDHRPPHFHAVYAEHEALFTINPSMWPQLSSPLKRFFVFSYSSIILF